MKIVDVCDALAAKRHKIGDEVVISTPLGIGHRAVALGFGIPFIILVVSLFASILFVGEENIAALISLASLFVYYIILYLFRDILQRKFTFYIDNH